MTRRLLLLLLAAAGAAGSPAAAVQSVDSIGITVSDLDRSLDFYINVLTFEKVSEHEYHGEPWEKLRGVFGLRARTARLRLGEEFLELTEYLAPESAPVPPGSRSNDRWFQHAAIIVSDMDAAYTRLRRFKVRHASTGPQRLPDWNKNAGGIEAFYFRDPDGHALEILRFPAGKGNPKWQRQHALFLGIDHTAIVVEDTDRSLAFYRDTLGLQVAGESENYGVEQEHLNNVFGARLRITALRGEAGPGVELLEYLAPRDGRPFPAEARASDLIHWQTRFLASSVPQAALALRKARTNSISSGVVDLPAESPHFRKAFLARDPDGHAVELAQP
jgi:catechol 2,3-dioxygenase-like lactoylglutathione lyase family enzyme